MGIVQDLHFALRTLFRSKMVAIVAVASLALIIAGNTVVMSVVNSLLIRPLAFDPEARLMLMWRGDDLADHRQAPAGSHPRAGARGLDGDRVRARKRLSRHQPGYSVAQRTREIGVRVALGASRGSLLGMVLRDGAGLAALGVVFALPLVFFVRQGLESIVEGMTAGWLLFLPLVTVALFAVILAASLAPAMRAARLSPTDALRAE